MVPNVADRHPPASASLPQLLAILHDSSFARTLTLRDWDGVVRTARRSRLLGRIAHQLVASQGMIAASLPPQVLGHFRSAINFAAHRKHAMRMELAALDAALPLGIDVVLLKGAAYIAQKVPFAEGRLPNDVDLLVRRADLAAAEAALKKGGWQSEITDDYDEWYYRDLSHELPPMRAPGHALQVDLHHTIAPVTSRVRANDELLFAGISRLPDSRFFVLDPGDQVIHAAIHLFQDSELDDTLRDLVDIDGLVRWHLRSVADWDSLVDRAAGHVATRLLWYAMHYCRTWLDTPVPEQFMPAPPGIVARAALDWVFTRICPPRAPDTTEGLGRRIAKRLARARYHYLRMPPALLVRHVWHKATHRQGRPARTTEETPPV